MTTNSPTLNSIAELMEELRDYAHQTIVVKIGGNSIAEDADFLEAIAKQLEFLQSRHVDVVLVHGGGPQIDVALQQAGIVPVKGADGRRLTDPQTMKIVAQIMQQLSELVGAALQNAGCKVALASNQGFVRAVPISNDPNDRTGKPVGLEAEKLRVLLDSGKIPVLKSIGQGDDGTLYNINADDFAMAVAIGLRARRLILATNVAGVYDADKKPISFLNQEKARELMQQGVITGGMIPKIESALSALTAGVGGVAIIDAHKNWALLGELLTHQGFGTLIKAA